MRPSPRASSSHTSLENRRHAEWDDHALRVGTKQNERVNSADQRLLSLTRFVIPGDDRFQFSGRTGRKCHFFAEIGAANAHSMPKTSSSTVHDAAKGLSGKGLSRNFATTVPVRCPSWLDSFQSCNPKDQRRQVTGNARTYRSCLPVK